MCWVRLLHKYSCEACGAHVERFVRLMRSGDRATEVTFCPACSPEVKKVVDIPGTNGNGGDTRRWGEALH
jgi:predicted nucleic acid-binding Zn ribbon protein